MGRPKLNPSPEIRKKAILLYSQGIIERDICKEVGLGMEVFKRVLNEENVAKRVPISVSDPHCLYSVNETFFDSPEIWTEKQAYWLGWLYSDGSNGGKQFSLKLQESDRSILDTLKDLIEYTGPLNFIKRPPSSILGGPVKQYQHRYSLCISNIKMCQRLAELGIYYGNSPHLDFPSYLNRDLYPHFLRGLYDGDGCFSFNKRNMFDSNLVVGIKLGNRIIDIYKEKGWYARLDGNQVYNNGVQTLRLTGPNQGIQLFNYLYQDANYWLPRKVDTMRRLRDYKQRIHPRHSNEADLIKFTTILERLK